jgi:hypothetical protein
LGKTYSTSPSPETYRHRRNFRVRWSRTQRQARKKVRGEHLEEAFGVRGESLERALGLVNL